MRRLGAVAVGMLWGGLAMAQTATAAPDAAEGPVRVTADVVLKVANKEKAQAAVVTKAEALKGYFSALNNDLVTVRVPVSQTDAMLSYLEELGLVANRNYKSDDLRERLSNQKARLAARKKVLEQYFKLLDTANSKAVITVEREITRLVSEIERYEGGIRLLEHDARLARVTVRFQFRDRTQPSRSRTSSFDWLNTLSVADLVEEAADVDPGSQLKTRVEVGAPDGFASYDTKRQHWFASPDGVVLRVRAAEHEPEADLAFWSEAMSKHLSGAGYRLHKEGSVTAGGNTGHLVEAHAAIGASDYAYSVALFALEKRLIIVEVAGPVEAYQERRAALVKSIEGMQL